MDLALLILVWANRAAAIAARMLSKASGRPLNDRSRGHGWSGSRNQRRGAGGYVLTPGSSAGISAVRAACSGADIIRRRTGAGSSDVQAARLSACRDIDELYSLSNYNW